MIIGDWVSAKERCEEVKIKQIEKKKKWYETQRFQKVSWYAVCITILMGAIFIFTN